MIKPDPELTTKGHPCQKWMSLCCSSLASLIMAFLIFFGLWQSCSSANIAIFLVLLGVSFMLVFYGIIAGAISYRKTKNRLSLISWLFGILYAALTGFLLQLTL
jgi:hypothetical protein